ncbi:MAG: Gfo/Idh/MocA family oxidoreductase [Actinobacteria bacterium]|nr:Gfo/Idh/MocA family oxidoreductase [Actinomycetota bacterium]MCG2817480.1 Gfo/Idh/MocA family oxidoreductase [Actinomycetes bacterium]MBU4217964.1 Gfo/Idh/MocA family oxidoreductase [Actinomycetota bacterium]MBU4357922.1 Gfo/Idh/MocA family oxidoreductase [Actinomycetota bacterium]MBU4393027.1 Gfo/Idh/MocA family oxidoreductase [Actinomycetota bacterium]
MEEKKRLRVGQIGCGYWGPNLVRAFMNLGDVDLVSVCDASPEMLDKVLGTYPALQGTGNADELIGNPEIDAVVVASSARTHFELSRKALEAGKHVLVEKPLSLNVSEGEELVWLSEEKGLTLMVGHLLLYHPAVQRVKEYLDSGEIGDVLYVYSQRLNLGRVRHDENCLWSLAPHDLSVITYLLEQEPVEVSTHGMSYLRGGIEDVVFCTLRFPDNVIANLHISWLDPHKVRRLTIVGSRKMMVFDDMSSGEKLRVYDKGVDFKEDEKGYQNALEPRFGDVLLPAVKQEEPLLRECRHFVECVQSGREPLSGGREGLGVLRILNAAQESLDSRGKPVRI